jgi:hypothetical protein
MRYAAALLTLLWLTGCSGRVDLTFRTVDGRTDEPMAGVEVNGVDEDDDILFGSRREELPPVVTGADGVVQIKGLHGGWAQQIRFTRPGFLNRVAIRSRGAKTVGISRRPDDPFQSKSVVSVNAVGVVVEIRMYPEGTPLAPYAPAWHEVPVSSVSARLIESAERDTRRYHIEPSKEWHKQAGALRTFASAYGDVRVLWVAPVGDVYRWEWVGFNSDAYQVELVSGGTPLEKGMPTPEAMRVLHAD